MSFDLQPILKSDLVKIRPLHPDDFEDLFAVASDPLIWEQHPVSNRYEEAEFRTFFQNSLESGGALLVKDAHTKAVIGSYRFYGYSQERSEIEIGWIFLARSHWGGAYNSEIIKLMAQHAFKFVDHVVYLVSPTNYRSRRAIEKLGGIQIAPRPDASGHHSHVYQIKASTLFG